MNHQHLLNDTIAAVATAVGEGGIGIVRVSGPHAIRIADAIFRAKSGRLLAATRPMRVRYGHVLDPEKKIVDEVLVTLFRAPHSYTSEDLVEIACHGGLKIVSKVLELVLRAGARAAGPGEFTRRAFLSGKMDLAQAEAVLDVIRAKTDAGMRAAGEQLRGNLSEQVRALRERLMKLYAHVEAFVDFPEEDIEVYSAEEVRESLVSVQGQIRQLLNTYQKGEIVRDGILTVIVGRANVGKSSLLNAMLDRDRAIVSEISGTTRDSLEEMIEIGGMIFRLVDTAGLGECKDTLDELSMRQTAQYLERGRIFLFLLDASAAFSPFDLEIANRLRGKKVIPVINKSDQPGRWRWSEAPWAAHFGTPIRISAKTRAGLEHLEKKLVDEVSQGMLETEGAQITRARHRDALEKALRALENGQAVFQRKDSLEFLSFELRAALDALAELIGEIYSEDLLDVIFSEFCIGK
ncbi:MAG: tRNA uridine-5-carboxymethylaminomethyl(34) synthesis GTPase MnmE [Candidatus Omnitrophica bacterium]|nr:tRNA uridine-5-carboxymethylaminomethyl(34) synthesis GTPase MnmE [Candidatus Omnitrophota bacterium]